MNGLQFFFFLLVIFTINYFLRSRYRANFILFVSYLFIALVDAAYLMPLIVVTGITYFGYLMIQSGMARKFGLRFIVILLVLVLIVFKFNDFFVLRVHQLFGISESSGISAFILPLGLSYYIFQSVAFLSERSKNRVEPNIKLTRLAAYLAFFPKISAGPIEKPHHFMPQLEDITRPSYERIRTGFILLVWGMLKKMVVADRIAVLIDPVFSSPGDYSGMWLVIAAILYVLQLYSDFSGYTDMAVGSAAVLGFRLTDNFNRPFSAHSIAEFWRKWHITLYTWVSEYIYRPFSGFLSSNLNNLKAARVLAIMVSFSVIGLWHGNRWNYLIFGLLHGLMRCAELFTGYPDRGRRGLWQRTISSLYVLGFFTFTCIIFRTGTIDEARYYFSSIFSGDASFNENIFLFEPNTDVLITLVFAGLLIVLEGVVFKKGIVTWFGKRPVAFGLGTIVLTLLLIAVFSAGEDIPFIYSGF